MDVRRDLDVLGARTRERDFVVEAADTQAGEAAVADLDPLARAVRAHSRAANPDPAGHMAVLDGGRSERGQADADPGNLVATGDAGIAVTGRSAGVSGWGSGENEACCEGGEGAAVHILFIA